MTREEYYLQWDYEHEYYLDCHTGEPEDSYDQDYPPWSWEDYLDRDEE